MQCLLGNTSFKQPLPRYAFTSRQPPSGIRPTTTILRRRWCNISDFPSRSYHLSIVIGFGKSFENAMPLVMHGQILARHQKSRGLPRYFSILHAQHDGDPLGKLQLFHLRRNSPVYSYIVANYDIRWGKLLHGIILLSLRKHANGPPIKK
jgi:hypothetical protein